jgi:hypothetical protein
MKNVYFRLGVVLLALLVIMAILSLSYVVRQVRAQEDGISELRKRLLDMGVPVKSLEATSRFPFRVEAILQSASSEENVSPADPQFVYAVQREAALAPRKNNPRISSVKVTIVNAAGKPIFWADEPVKVIDEIPVPSPRLDDTGAAAAVRQNISLHGMVLDELTVSSEQVNGQTLKLKLNVHDVQAANNSIPPFMEDLRQLPEKLNSELGTQIMVVQVDIFDAKGQPLLKYIRDLELSKEKWWQPDDLTKEWFPHPPPAGE